MVKLRDIPTAQILAQLPQRDYSKTLRVRAIEQQKRYNLRFDLRTGKLYSTEYGGRGAIAEYVHRADWEEVRNIIPDGGEVRYAIEWEFAGCIFNTCSWLLRGLLAVE